VISPMQCLSVLVSEVNFHEMKRWNIQPSKTGTLFKHIKKCLSLSS
jgi:hypothetical protein